LGKLFGVADAFWGVFVLQAGGDAFEFRGIYFEGFYAVHVQAADYGEVIVYFFGKVLKQFMGGFLPRLGFLGYSGLKRVPGTTAFNCGKAGLSNLAPSPKRRGSSNRAPLTTLTEKGAWHPCVTTLLPFCGVTLESGFNF
jgi:hypothetical protein